MVRVTVVFVVLALVGCASEPPVSQKEPSVDDRMKLIEKQKDVPQEEKDGLKQVLQSYKDKDEFENTASH